MLFCSFGSFVIKSVEEFLSVLAGRADIAIIHQRSLFEDLPSSEGSAGIWVLQR